MAVTLESTLPLLAPFLSPRSCAHVLATCHGLATRLPRATSERVWGAVYSSCFGVADDQPIVDGWHGDLGDDHAHLRLVRVRVFFRSFRPDAASRLPDAAPLTQQLDASDGDDIGGGWRRAVRRRHLYNAAVGAQAQAGPADTSDDSVHAHIQGFLDPSPRPCASVDTFGAREAFMTTQWSSSRSGGGGGALNQPPACSALVGSERFNARTRPNE
jgi:hypothetical protein